MDTLVLQGKGLVLSAPMRIMKETKCRAAIKRDDPLRLVLEGEEKDLCDALELISREDLFAEVNIAEGADGILSEKRIRRLLREEKKKRFMVLLVERFKAEGLEVCPINRFGYVPFPFNTPKSLRADQERDVALIAACIKNPGSKICGHCMSISLQRALAERGND